MENFGALLRFLLELKFLEGFVWTLNRFESQNLNLDRIYSDWYIVLMVTELFVTWYRYGNFCRMVTIWSLKIQSSNPVKHPKKSSRNSYKNTYQPPNHTCSLFFTINFPSVIFLSFSPTNPPFPFDYDWVAFTEANHANKRKTNFYVISFSFHFFSFLLLHLIFEMKILLYVPTTCERVWVDVDRCNGFL